MDSDQRHIHIYAIIVAGGSGTRFGNAMPKQFLPLAGVPVLLHTVKRFTSHSADITPIVVLPSAQIDTWLEICRRHDFAFAGKIVAGGSSRYHSVKNAIEAINCDDPEAIVLIHDGVRPLVSHDLITRAIDAARLHSAAVPVVDVTDSIRLIDGNGSRTVDRSSLKAVQTPQAFRLSVIRNAYITTDDRGFTDDAAVAEASGASISLFEGDRDNFKITFPRDLQLANLLLQERHE